MADSLQDDDPASDHVSPVTADDLHERRKRHLLVWMVIYALLLGTVTLLLPEDETLDLVLGIPFLVLAFGWCLADARSRNLRIGLVNRVLILIFFAIGFPIYILRTRSWGAWKTFSKCIVFGLILIVCMWLPPVPGLLDAPVVEQ